MSTLLKDPHPAIESIDASNFDYAGYPWEHCKGELRDGNVLLVTLDRPEQMNTFSTQQGQALKFLFQLADRDDRVKVVVLTGAGKAFCAGADLTSKPAFGVDHSASDPVAAHRDRGGGLALTILNCRKLTIAAINGTAVGIGMTMTFACDLRIAAAGAKMGVPFVKRGIPCDAVSSYILPRLIGHSNANKLLLTGDIFTTDSPHLASLFLSLHPKEEVLPTALSLASRLAAQNSSISMALVKAQVWRPATRDVDGNTVESSIEQTHIMESQALAFTAVHGDAPEGVASFMEKRPANFKGKVSDIEKAVFWPWWNKRDIAKL